MPRVKFEIESIDGKLYYTLEVAGWYWKTADVFAAKLKISKSNFVNIVHQNNGSIHFTGMVLFENISDCKSMMKWMRHQIKESEINE